MQHDWFIPITNLLTIKENLNSSSFNNRLCLIYDTLMSNFGVTNYLIINFHQSSNYLWFSILRLISIISIYR